MWDAFFVLLRLKQFISKLFFIGACKRPPAASAPTSGL
jgi:hypothetical protein